ncbi:hypothetical protein NFI96_002417 [Prochilodus magdalenae]|nr:hypothetical protein NFI96_002417 [Prochilodus magdalenae]
MALLTMRFRVWAKQNRESIGLDTKWVSLACVPPLTRGLPPVSPGGVATEAGAGPVMVLLLVGGAVLTVLVPLAAGAVLVLLALAVGAARLLSDTRENTLDHMYTNIKEAFSTTPLPSFGKSYNISLLMKPTYRQLLKRSAATTDSLVDINEYATSVTGFIMKCVDNLTQTKQIRTLPNQKPWMNSDVRSLLKAHDAAFKSGNSEELKVARHNLKAGIRTAKHKYSSQIAAHFNTNSDPRRMWQGIQVITDYKSKVSTPVTTDAALPAELNNFYARFETSAQAQSSNTALLPTTEEETPLILAADEVRRALMRVSTRKAACPDGIPGRTLKACASQLALTFTDIFNLSLAESTVPVCF